MNTDQKTKIGEALNSALSPFHMVAGSSLKSVWQVVVDDDLVTLQLEFEPGCLTVTVDPKDDTVDLTLTKSLLRNATCVSHMDPWQQLIGQNFGWGWAGINQQGYLDGISFSFQSVLPQFSLTAVASALRLARTQPITTSEAGHLAPQPLYEPAAKYA